MGAVHESMVGSYTVPPGLAAFSISARRAAGVRHDAPRWPLWHMRWQLAQRKARSSSLVSRGPERWRGRTWCTSM